MSNNFYTATGNPLTRSLSNSAAIRAEFANVQAAFDRLPNPLVGSQGFADAYLEDPVITGGTLSDASLSLCDLFFCEVFASRLALAHNALGYASPSLGLLTDGAFGAYKTTKTNSPISLGMYTTTLPDDDAYLLFDEWGNVIFGDGTDAKPNAAVEGFMMIPKTVSIPTGTPGHTYASSVPMVYDGTNNKIYVYNGSWKATAALT